MMLHRSTMKMLSDLISPKALERILSDAARDRHTTLSALDAATLQDILKRDIYRRLQLSVPAALAKRRVQEVIDTLTEDQGQHALSSHSTQVVTLEEQARQFALYFDWPETQRLRAVLSVARQTTAEGKDAEALLQEGAELIDGLGRKLSEGLVTQGQDLSELKASSLRLGGVGGPKVKRLEALIKQISEAQETRTLLPAEMERALALTLTLRKQIESSVVQQLHPTQKREMIESLALQEQGEIMPFDLSQLPPEAQARVQTLEREHEARLLTELAREYAALLRHDAPLNQDVQALRERSVAGEVLGEAALSGLRERLALTRTQMAGAQQDQLAEFAARLTALQHRSGDTGEHHIGQHYTGEHSTDEAMQLAQQGLSVAQVTLQAGGLAGDEVSQLGELISTLENSDLLTQERLIALQRESFELERRAREIPGALNDLAGLIEAARAELAGGQMTDLEPLWGILERRMGEAAQQRENMDTRAARVMQDYDRYRHLAGETIQKLGRLADVLRDQQRLGVLSSDAHGRYLHTLENAEALLTEAQAEFEAAREVTAAFGADALSDLLGVFDPDAFDQNDAATDLLSTVSFASSVGTQPQPASTALGGNSGGPIPEPGAQHAKPTGLGNSPVPGNDPFGLGNLLGAAPTRPPLTAQSASARPSDTQLLADQPLAAQPFSVAGLELDFAGPLPHAPSEAHAGTLTRTWLVEHGQVVEGDLSPAGNWRTETDCEADVLRLAWLADQAAELHPTRLSVDMAGQCWMALPQPGLGVLVVCGPDQTAAASAAGSWRARVS